MCDGNRVLQRGLVDANNDFLHVGDKVEWTPQFARFLYQNSRAHRKEFLGQVGEIIGLTDYGTQKGPEVDVRFTESNKCGPCSLRYAYDAESLVIVPTLELS